jgi:hypothetical protein
VKVETPTGTDYIFLGPEEFTFQEGEVSFQGTVGAIQLRGERGVLALGAAGRISAQGQSLAAEKAAVKRWKP